MGAVTSPTRTVPVAILAACMVTVGSGSPITIRVAAQAASPSALKAAFLFNFAKFAEWPALPADAPVRVCVAGDALVATALVDTLRGQSIETHGLQAIQLASDGSARGCQVLFLSAGEAGRAATLLSDATASPVLTVSDAEKFAQSGGMVELFVEGGRMKFAINVDAVQRSRIRLSSRLLGLARIVRDQHGS
jgi:hypothetical protein